MCQDVKLQIFQQIHTPSGNRLTGSYFRSVTSYDTLTSFTALTHTHTHVHTRTRTHMCTHTYVYTHIYT